MKVEIDDRPVIAADGTASARFGNQGPFDLLESTNNGFTNAPLANPPAPTVSTSVEGEFRDPMTLAIAQLDRTSSSQRWRGPLVLEEWSGRVRTSLRHEHMFAAE
jgi:hypothetical protein